MIHQPSGGASGQASDIAIHAREILRVRERLNKIYQRHTGIREIETIGKDKKKRKIKKVLNIFYTCRENGRKRLFYDCRRSHEFWFNR